MHLNTRAIAAGIFLLFLLLACSQVLTKRPWVDEAWFAGPALDLATHGRLGTPVLDPAGSHLRLYKPDAVLTGIGEHTYWVMPLHLLQLAAWVKVFGFSVFTIRMPSVFWGLVALASTGIIVRRLLGSSSAALIAMAVLAADFGFVDTAADGRMDMTCAGLGFAALAVYLSLRETNFQRALMVSHSLAAAALLTHPNGLFDSAALLLTMVYLDRGRWKRTKLWPIVLPYVAGIGAWLLYGLSSPSDFWAQFSANSAGRSNDLLMPWRGIWREITGRYLTHYWPSGSWPGKTKIIGLLFSIGAVVMVALSPQLRKSAGCRLLVALTALRFLLMSVAASAKFMYYMVHMIPYFAALAGIAAWYLLIGNRRWQRVLGGLGLVAYFAVQGAAIYHRTAVTAGYAKEYEPLIRFLRSAAAPGDEITGSAELAFDLGFYNPRLSDDVWLGYWSHRRPAIIVVDRWYYEEVLRTAAQRGFPIPDYFEHLLTNDYCLLKELNGYRVYRRRS